MTTLCPGMKWFAAALVALATLFATGAASAIPDRPETKDALWSGQVWGLVRALPRIARHGDQVHIHGMVVGGPAADPWWSCSQYEAWVANGTSEVHVVVPGDWELPNAVVDFFGNHVNILARDAGEPPPYGWEERISDTCYCIVTGFGAQGGCESREYQPKLFHAMDQFNPREGNVQFATVTSGTGWTPVDARFSGRAGVGWGDWATQYIYVVSDLAQLDEDEDGDLIPDAWEIAHSPSGDLDTFGGSPVGVTRAQMKSDAPPWINPYAPSMPDWVPASADDWDGDGVSDRDEYAYWLAGKTDGEGVPYDPTYRNAEAMGGGGGCVSGAESPSGPGAWLVIVGVLVAAALRRRRGRA